MYVVRRLLLLIPQMLLISMVTFALIRALPGDPARLQLGPLATDQGVAELRHAMSLDQPIPVQYVAYLNQVLHGNLGTSWVNSSQVADDLRERLPATLELLTYGLLFILLIIIPVGAITAARGGGRVQRAMKRIVSGYGFLAGAIPDFWLGLILILLLFTVLHIAPGPEGRLSIGAMPPPTVTGFYTIDSLLHGDLATFEDAMRHLALPVITLGFVYGGSILKTTQLTVGKALRSEYTAFEEGLGVSHRQILILAVKNSAPPIVVMTGIVVGFLLGGAVLIETVFNLNGIGQYAVQAVTSADYAPVQAFVLIAAVFTMLVYLVVDLIYFAVDPRVRHRGPKS